MMKFDQQIIIKKKNQLPWLLEGDNPSVRYFTMIDLLDKPRDCPEVVRAKQEILQKGIVPKILAKQKEEGYIFRLGKCQDGGGRHSGVIPCLTGNMVYSFIIR